jgi:hypothetical protein
MTPRVDAPCADSAPGISTSPGGDLPRTEPVPTTCHISVSTYSSVPVSAVDVWPVLAAPVQGFVSSPEVVAGASMWAPAAGPDNLFAPHGPYQCIYFRNCSRISCDSWIWGTTVSDWLPNQISASALDNSIAASTCPHT